MSASPASGPAAIERAPRQINLIDLVGRYAPTLFLLVLIIILSILEPAFRTETNLFQVMRQISITGIIAVGMTFVILTGGIDLSVGSVLAFSGIVGASAAKGTRSLISGGVTDRGGVHVLYGALAAIGVGLAIGVIQGFVIAKMRVPPFVATLGGLGIWRGATLVWSNGEPISSFSKDFTYWGKGFVGRVPVPVIFFLGLVVVGHIVLRYTRYGRWIYALGGNPEAARLSGLNTTGLTMSVYVISGFCAGLGGFLLTSRLNSAEQIAGQGYELTVIASVVIGGTSLFGGEGRVFGTLIGAMLIGVLTNGLVLLNVSSYWQPIVIGLIVVFSVFFDQLLKRRGR
jgi:ribose/xylose/arabinose/galactoside ABC-type transport system permease subunit